jgi:putative ABC transport system permease protein
MALAVALLVTAGLLARGFARVLKVDPGFAPDHVITAGLSLPASAYPDAAARRGFWTRLLEQVDRVPGVSAAGLISTVPFSGALSSGTFHVAGHTLAAGERPPHARIDLVAGRYFAALRIPLREGRLLDDRDGPDTPRAVVVDERLASRQFPGASAVGRQLDFDGPRTYTIVGVVGSILDRDLAEAVPEGRIYLAARQLGADRLSLTVRTSGAPAPLAAAIRAAVQAVDPDLAPSEIRTMDAWLTRSLGSRRTPTTVLALFSAAAIALAAIGIYAVVGFSVAERRPELGIRQALGASPRHIMRLIFAQGLGTAAAGVASGLGIAAAASRLLEAFLFEVGSRDPAVFGAAAALVLAVAAVACWIPANRAANVNPSAALKIH